MDVCKIASNLYQYTAIDDCTRYKILALYKRRTAINTVSFLGKVLTHMPFPIQRIQTDRGQEFFAYIVQDYLKEHKIKFRPIKPLSPHLNGKVERSQKTDLDEFYSSVDIRSIELPSNYIIGSIIIIIIGDTLLLLGKHLGKNFRILNHLFLLYKKLRKIMIR